MRQLPVRWLRRCRALLVATLVAAPVGADQGERRRDAATLMNELMSGRAAVGAPFALRDPDGRTRRLADFRGRVVLLYFGYTGCPDVCPTDLSAMARAIDLLGDDAPAVQPIFVTLDPERDTAAVLRGYASAFDPRFVALRGTPAETRAIAGAWKVFYEKVRPPNGGAYVIDHSAFIYLLDRDGRYVAFVPPGTPPQRLATMLRELLLR